MSNHRNILAYYSVPENRNAKGVGGGRGGGKIGGKSRGRRKGRKKRKWEAKEEELRAKGVEEEENQ